MSDIWSVGGSDNDSVDNASDDWNCSGSDSEEARPSKRPKRGAKQAQRVAITFDDSQPQADELQGAVDEDELLADYLSPQQDRQAGKASGKAGKQRSPSPLLIDLEAPLAAAAAGAGAGKRSKRKAAAEAGTGVNGRDVQDPMRQEIEQQRALRQQLASATHAADDDDGDDIEILDSDDDALPSPLLRPAPVLDDTSLLLEELGGSQLDAEGLGGGPPGGAEEPKLALVFQAQGRDDITVRIGRTQPLRQAMDKFSAYAEEQGWGRVVKFMFDGAPLNGGDTPEDLDLDGGEKVDVYLEN